MRLDNIVIISKFVPGSGKITFTDVFLALRKHAVNEYVVDGDGLFGLPIGTARVYMTGGDFTTVQWKAPVCWNFYKDNLLEQPDETIAFIAALFQKVDKV